VERLFATGSYQVGIFAQLDYDVSPDGSGFFMISEPANESEPVVMIFDWFDELRTRVPANR
jgi:hypothetical protein